MVSLSSGTAPTRHNFSSQTVLLHKNLKKPLTLTNKLTALLQLQLTLITIIIIIHEFHRDASPEQNFRAASNEMKIQDLKFTKQKQFDLSWGRFCIGSQPTVNLLGAFSGKFVIFTRQAAHIALQSEWILLHSKLVLSHINYTPSIWPCLAQSHMALSFHHRCKPPHWKNTQTWLKTSADTTTPIKWHETEYYNPVPTFCWHCQLGCPQNNQLLKSSALTN